MATGGCVEVLGGSSDDRPAAETAGSSSLNAAALRERRQRRKLRLKKLEKRLEILDRHIKKCAEAEVSLDEMGSGYSAYMKEDLLKRKFVRTWKELCELQHVKDSIVIEDRESSSYEGTPYPEVNRRIQRLLRLDEFPDYLDIVQLLDRCSSKHGLGIGAEEKNQLARKVFKDVGKILKRSRHRDFVHHFGSHLTDSFSTSSDPAEKDEDLLKRLQESQREGEKKMEAVVEEFVAKQEYECSGHQSLEGDSCSANEQEEEEEEEEEQEEKEVEVLLAEEESEMHTDLHQQSPIPTQLEEEREGEEEEEEEVAIDVEGKLEQEPMAADSTTIRSSSPEVTSTHQRQGSVEPGPSGVTSADITSSCDVVCLDDDDDVIILSDSDPV